MLGVRVSTFNENLGEPEQDANSALTELDKGKFESAFVIPKLGFKWLNNHSFLDPTSPLTLSVQSHPHQELSAFPTHQTTLTNGC